MTNRVREIMVTPGEKAKLEIEPDGVIQLLWPKEGLTVRMSRDEFLDLATTSAQFAELNVRPVLELVK